MSLGQFIPPPANLREKLTERVVFRETESWVKRARRVVSDNPRLNHGEPERVCARVGVVVLEYLESEGLL